MPLIAKKVCQKLVPLLVSRGLSNLADAFGAAPPLPQRRVVVTGLGLVCPLGSAVQVSWNNLIKGGTGVRKLVEEDLPEDPKRSAPFISYALCAAAEALEDAAWHPQTQEQQRATGVAIGAGMSCTYDVADVGMLIASDKLRRLSPFFVPKILVNMAAGAIGIRYGLQGPNHAVSTACATGVHSTGDAFRMIQRGDADVMVAGATEACIDAVSLAGFGRMKALSTQYNDQPHRASRPFDAGRDGFVMGEGAGVLVLEELEHARSRGARMYAEVRGYGLSGDGFHITQPEPSGRGAVLAMQRALLGSGVDASDVAYVNAHATSTPRGDEIEQMAIHKVFGEEAVQQLLVSSTKGATGHLLGAAGAVETVFTVLALHHRLAPPTVNLERPDPPLLPGLVRQQAKELRQGPMAALCNSFGFGGTNTSLLLTTAPPAS